MIKRTVSLTAVGAGCLVAALACTIALLPTSAAAAEPGNSAWWGDDDSSTWTGAGGGWYGGQSGSGSRWTPEQARTLQLRDLRIDTAAISPDGNGVADAATVELRLRRASSAVSLRVVDAAGTTIRQLGTITQTGVQAAVSWDGLDAVGARVPDGPYRIVLETPVIANEDAPAEADPAPTTPAADTVALDVRVDTTFPTIAATRPSLKQLAVLAKRAAKLRDERARRAKAARRWAHRHGNSRHGERNPSTSSDARNWQSYWDAQQLRIPVALTVGEEGAVTIVSTVGTRSTELETWRAAGTHSVNVVLPKYIAGAKAQITVSAADDAGNTRTHTVVVKLPALPAARKSTRSASGGSTSNPVPTTVTGKGGPLPDWLDPIMLRATYAAGVPQSWATSNALYQVIKHESSFRPTAQNPTSTAYGMFQFLDSTWANVGCTKTNDAYQQSVCGLRYIQRRYRTPERAWAFWQANHWY